MRRRALHVCMISISVGGDKSRQETRKLTADFAPPAASEKLMDSTIRDLRSEIYDQRSTRTHSFYSIEHICSPQKDTSKMAMKYMYALFLAVVAAAVGAPEAAAAGDGDDLFKTSFWRVC